MRTIGHQIRVIAAVGVLAIGVSRSGTAQMAHSANRGGIEAVHITGYRAKTPPHIPAARSETRGRAPSRGATWVPGFWNLQGDLNSGPRAGWVWVPGQWMTPPVQHARWDPAHWGWSSDWWSWVPGHWVAAGPHGYPPSLQADQTSQALQPQYESQ